MFVSKKKVRKAISPLLVELKKHIGREGGVTITKPMCIIIISRLEELTK